MQKYKILWLCNLPFTYEMLTSTGGWLQPLAEMLQLSGKVEIFNVTSGNISEVQASECNGIKQWILPHNKNRFHSQVASRHFCEMVAEIEKEVNPDLVHIWGTESVWVSVYAQGYIKNKAFVDIQGILSSSYYYYYGGLRFTELLRSLGIKEILKPWSSLAYQKYSFKRRGKVELDSLKHFNYISYQSEWVRRELALTCPNALFLKTKIMLRSSFYDAAPWQYKGRKNAPVVFSTASGSISYKGFHILLRAIGWLKAKYPNIQLHIAGQMKGRLMKSGYTKYLESLIRELGLVENVVFLGSIDEHQIVTELQNADVTVIPSFVETYCLAFAESMMVGTPTIASYAGAMPELAEDGKEAFFYNSMDFISCAYYIDQLVTDKELSMRLSANGRAKRLVENDRETVLQTQLNIYNTLIKG